MLLECLGVNVIQTKFILRKRFSDFIQVQSQIFTFDPTIFLVLLYDFDKIIFTRLNYRHSQILLLLSILLKLELIQDLDLLGTSQSFKVVGNVLACIIIRFEPI